jgi:hypothetical protein
MAISSIGQCIRIGAKESTRTRSLQPYRMIKYMIQNDKICFNSIQVNLLQRNILSGFGGARRPRKRDFSRLSVGSAVFAAAAKKLRLIQSRSRSPRLSRPSSRV